MDWHKIEHLVEKYYNGTTTLQEEKLLQQAFLRDDVPQQFSQEVLLFSVYEQEQTNEYVSPIQWEAIRKEVVPKSTKKYSLWYAIAGVAASLLFVLMAVINSTQTTTNKQVAYVYIDGKPIYDKEIARLKTVEALQLVSNKMNTTTKHINQLEKIKEPYNILNQKQ